MTKTHAIGLFALGLILGCFIGILANGDIYYFAGKQSAKGEARQEAMRWAEEELKRHCVSWHTDRRKDDYIACIKPDWMK
jgi:hypothetical protein